MGSQKSKPNAVKVVAWDGQASESKRAIDRKEAQSTHIDPKVLGLSNIDGPGFSGLSPSQIPTNPYINPRQMPPAPASLPGSGFAPGTEEKEQTLMQGVVKAAKIALDGLEEGRDLPKGNIAKAGDISLPPDIWERLTKGS